jgi:hypothetical protein
MEQHGELFKNSGGIKMQDLLFFNPALTHQELKFEAEGIADFLDRAFVNTAGAVYDNCNRLQALEDMVNVLIKPNKTMSDLGEQVDINYEF